MKTYIATRQINHDNQIYEASDMLELDDRAAKQLLAVGAIEAKPVTVDPGSANTENGDASKTAAVITDAATDTATSESASDVQEQQVVSAEGNADQALQAVNGDKTGSKTDAHKSGKKAK